MNKLRKFNSKYMFLILVFIICFIGLFVYLKGDMYKCEILSEDEFATLKTWTVEKDNSKVILIAGGLDRGNEFDELVPDITGVKLIVILGESAPRVKRAADKANVPYVDAKDVADAARIAYDKAEAGDVVLLSPANASWDMYKSFEVRGDEFIATFEAIKGE